MHKLVDVDWSTMFVPSSSLLEIIIRGTITYWIIFLYFRLFRRGTGQLSISDLLLITMVADAAQNAMAGNYESITEGAVLVGTLVFWDYVIDWLGYHAIFFARLAEPDPILLIKDGQMIRQNMRRQMIGEEELMGQLREKGIDDYREVKRCFLEGSGNISVIKK